MKHAIRTIPLDTRLGNVITIGDMPLGARFIGGGPDVQQAKIALRGEGGGIVPSVVVQFDPEETRREARRLVVLRSERNQRPEAVEFSDTMIPICTIVMPGSGIAFAIFETPMPAAELAEVDGGCSPRHLSGAMDGGGPP